MYTLYCILKVDKSWTALFPINSCLKKEGRYLRNLGTGIRGQSVSLSLHCSSAVTGHAERAITSPDWYWYLFG